METNHPHGHKYMEMSDRNPNGRQDQLERKRRQPSLDHSKQKTLSPSNRLRTLMLPVNHVGQGQMLRYSNHQPFLSRPAVCPQLCTSHPGPGWQGKLIDASEDRFREGAFNGHRVLYSSTEFGIIFLSCTLSSLWAYGGLLKWGYGFSIVNHLFMGYPHLWKPPYLEETTPR